MSKLFAGIFGRKSEAEPYFRYDCERLEAYSAAFHQDTREQQLAHIIVRYHVLEKGLTMPNRRLGFGRLVVEELMTRVLTFEEKFGKNDSQVRHAAGVIRTYWDLHAPMRAEKKPEDQPFWEKVERFLGLHSDVPGALQPRMTRAEFYAARTSPFPAFAHARHTLRHYSPEELPVARIKDAVALALTTPTACNRQPCRVHCISDKETMAKILALQGGSRGFGQFASKLLLVTSDLEYIIEPRERDDLFTNGGMFLMNLCYALYFYEIAYCILNWSRKPEEDLAMRSLVRIKPSETVVAMLSCGLPTEAFDVCSSPRKSVDDVFVENV